MSQEIYNCLDCQTCIENLEYENYNCDINDIFKNINVDSGFMTIDYYKTLMFFSGCPRAFYIQNKSIISIIKAKKLTNNFDITKESFIIAECILTYLEDSKIQEIGEFLERKKRGDL